MKSHRQQVHVEGEWHPYEPSTTQSFDTEWDSQSTWPTSFTLNMHISSPREGINLHPCVGRGCRSHPVCESVYCSITCTVYPMVATMLPK